MFDHKIDLIIVKILAAERLVYINGDQTVGREARAEQAAQFHKFYFSRIFAFIYSILKEFGSFFHTP